MVNRVHGNMVRLLEMMENLLENAGHAESILQDGNKKAGQCERCPQYCVYCNYDSTFCNLCEDSSYIDHYRDDFDIGFGHVVGSNGEYTGMCKLCSSNCFDCPDADKCDECFEGFGKIRNSDGSSTGICGACPVNCYECYDNNKICDECDLGYGYARDSNGLRNGKCEKCKIQNCEICNNDLAICTGCLDGFYSESVEGVITKCSPCLSNCERCDNSSTCRRCNNGYYVKDGKCSDTYCPENCESCSSDTYCEYCNKGYKLSNGKCIKNTDHCEDGFSDECVHCSKGYGPILENNKKTDKCGPCPANCFDCRENKDYCIYCKDNYCYDENPTSSTYRQCIACNNNDDNVECLVEGCIACKPGKSDQCDQCNSTLELDQNFKCVKSISTLASPTPKPFEGSISYDAVDDNGKITYDFDEQNKDGDANQPIVLRLDREKNDGYNSK